MVYNMQVPVLPLYGAKIGLNNSQIGVFVGMLMFAGITVRLFANQLIYIFSKRKLLFLGISLYLIATVGYPLLATFSLLLLLRIVNGIGHGLATTYFATMAADELPPKSLGTGMGYFGVGETVTASLAPVLALSLVQQVSYNSFFVACAVILVLAIALLLLTNKKEQSERSSKKERFSFKKMFIPGFLAQNFLIFLLGIMMSGIMAFTSVYAKQQNLTTVAWFFFAAAIAGVVIRPFSGRIFDFKGPFLVLLPASLGLLVSIFLIIYSKTNLMLIIAGVFYGAADGAIFPTIQAWVLKKAGIAKREVATSMFLNCYDFGMGIGASILGKVADLTSYRFMFIVLAFMAAFYILLCFYFPRKKSTR